MRVGATDSILRIGALLPDQIMTATQQADVRTALMATIDTVNARGGLQGTPVELLIANETGNRVTDAATIESLLDAGIDALIGPSSASNVERMVNEVTTAGVGVCSPVATTLSLTKVPEDGLVMRTVPSDAAIAAAMAQRVVDSGYVTASIVYPDDPYGRAFLNVLHAEMAARNLNASQDNVTLDVDLPYTVDADGTWSSEVDFERISTRVMLVIGNANVADEILTRLPVKRVITNDGFIDVDASTITTTSGDGILTSLVSFEGVAVNPYAGSAALVTDLLVQGIEIDSSIPFLSSFVDCLDIMVLSALTVPTDDPRVFFSAAEEVTTSGSKCLRIDECLDLRGQVPNFDYDGPTGGLDLDDRREVVSGPLVLYTFTPDGRAQPFAEIRSP